MLKILQEQGFTDLSDTVPIILVNLNELLEIKGGGSRGIKGLTDYQYSYVTNGAGDIVKENKKYAIYILDKLPKIYFDSVLAHEYLHVWLFENKQDYKSSITEGFCNLGAFAIYNSVNDKFSEIQLENMNQNPDPDYGVGYRTMKKCLDQKGWTDLINEVGSGNATISFEEFGARFNDLQAVQVSIDGTNFVTVDDNLNYRSEEFLDYLR